MTSKLQHVTCMTVLSSTNEEILIVANLFFLRVKTGKSNSMHTVVPLFGTFSENYGLPVKVM